MEVNNKILSLARKHLASVQAYSSAQNEYQSRDAILLNANENPLGGAFCRYPNSDPKELKTRYLQFLKTASKLKLAEENLLFTNGSDEGIDMLIRCFCEPKEDAICAPSPTFTMYESWAKANAVKVLQPLLEGENFDILPEKAILDAQAKILFLCSPNNPVGSSLKAEQVVRIAKKFQGLVIVDEAYQEFSEKPSILENIQELDNIVVLRTFSKAWGMAGLRLGIIVADPAVIGILKRIKAPYNVNSAAQNTALQALADKATYEQNRAFLLAERQRMSNQLLHSPSVVRIFPSDANFLLVEFVDHQAVYQTLLEAGVVVRDRSKQVASTLRFTIGKKEENDLVLKIVENRS